MSATSVMLTRTDVSTGLTYENLVRRFEEVLGVWGASAAQELAARHAPWSEVEAAASKAGGSIGLMIIAAINQGVLTSLSGRTKKCRLYLVGNPVIASGVLDINPHAALYVPFRVALFEGSSPTSAIISFDRPGSSLALLGDAKLDEVGRQLDRKIDAVVSAVCDGPSH